ncbi:MAG: MBL fold metallo-hydrolase [Actinobacteria bacterium]|nr:MBL fold metallo-hydrolase [Actinomycetota bacterium]
MGQPAPLDLHHQGDDRVIGVYLLETPDGPVLFDCGPTSCLPALKEQLSERGLAVSDLRHLLLSHIHLDHAGAAGVLVREHPDLQVHVSEIGAPHLLDPSRLERSARRLYGDTFDVLWGELAPIPAENVQLVREQVLGLDCFPSPGHASHHVCYLDGDGTLYAGDAAGVRILPGRYIAPVTPPPDVDLESWERTIDEIERRAPERLALIHFGVVESPHDHLRRQRRELRVWGQRVRQGMSEGDFIGAARADLEEMDEGEQAPYYERAAPFWQSYAGLKRYWDKQLADVSEEHP